MLRDSELGRGLGGGRSLERRHRLVRSGKSKKGGVGAGAEWGS